MKITIVEWEIPKITAFNFIKSQHRNNLHKQRKRARNIKSKNSPSIYIYIFSTSPRSTHTWLGQSGVFSQLRSGSHQLLIKWSHLIDLIRQCSAGDQSWEPLSYSSNSNKLRSHYRLEWLKSDLFSFLFFCLHVADKVFSDQCEQTKSRVIC